jgi:hypothetical protein
MRQSRWTPTIVPNAGDPNVYLVLDCVEQSGCAWREADAGKTDLEQRVIAFNTFEHSPRARAGSPPMAR